MFILTCCCLRGQIAVLNSRLSAAPVTRAGHPELSMREVKSVSVSVQSGGGSGGSGPERRNRGRAHKSGSTENEDRREEDSPR